MAMDEGQEKRIIDAINGVSTGGPGSGGLTDTQLRAAAVPVSNSTGATSAKQDTGNTSLASLDTKTPTLGQKTAAGSRSVVLSSDGPFATNFGVQADTPATSDSGSFSFIALFKRLLQGAQARQYAGTPSNFTIGTTNATVFTLAAGEIGFVQNLAAIALAVKKGASASTSSFSFILAAGAAASDGTGGAVKIDDWVGAVSVCAMSGTASYIAWKQAA